MRAALVVLLGLLLIPGAAEAAKPSLIKDAVLSKQIEKIAGIEKKGKLEEAQKAYEKLLRQYALTASQQRKVRQRLDSVNVKMFFSPEKTPGSFFYTVKEGDTLFEISMKHKTNMELIKKTNRVNEEDELKRGRKLKLIKGTFSIEVDKSENYLILFFDKKRVKRYSVTTGANNKTPVGTYKIVNKVANPAWYYEDKVIPAGSKENRLGTRWMGFDKPSYGIHGTVEPEDIGKQASLGCVRMLNRDVEELYTLVPLETSVTIKN